MDALEVEKTRQRLVGRGGGYEIIHDSPGLEVGVYVLVAPEPDHQNAHADDELYVVLEGRGELTIEGDTVVLHEDGAAFVPAGADHRFTGYEGLSVLVIFARQKEETPLHERQRMEQPL
ncbi:MAG: cupin domain-containing protein [Actinobacteria bacterium]|nr:cupin domain-containing protein [Actinomycetota bacterium]